MTRTVPMCLLQPTSAAWLRSMRGETTTANPQTESLMLHAAAATVNDALIEATVTIDAAATARNGRGPTTSKTAWHGR